MWKCPSWLGPLAQSPRNDSVLDGHGDSWVASGHAGAKSYLAFQGSLEGLWVLVVHPSRRRPEQCTSGDSLKSVQVVWVWKEGTLPKKLSFVIFCLNAPPPQKTWRC